MSGDEGVMATLLVQQGTLTKGDIIVCAAPAYGRVRAMYDDLGLPIKRGRTRVRPVESPASTRCPNADDPFYVVEDLAKAREIAETRILRSRRRHPEQVQPGPNARQSSAAKSKEDHRTEGDPQGRGPRVGRGDRKELEKLIARRGPRARAACRHRRHHRERTSSSPSPAPDTLVIGFNVTADDAALRLAEERGISLREYDIIYKLTDDVKAALEGQAQADRGGRPPGPGGRPRDLQDQQGRHHRWLLRHQRGHRAQRPRAGHPQGVVIYPPSDAGASASTSSSASRTTSRKSARASSAAEDHRIRRREGRRRDRSVQDRVAATNAVTSPRC
jgi:hypothetical protein